MQILMNSVNGCFYKGVSLFGTFSKAYHKKPLSFLFLSKEKYPNSPSNIKEATSFSTWKRDLWRSWGNLFLRIKRKSPEKTHCTLKVNANFVHPKDDVVKVGTTIGIIFLWKFQQLIQISGVYTSRLKSKLVAQKSWFVIRSDAHAVELKQCTLVPGTVNRINL